MAREVGGTELGLSRKGGTVQEKEERLVRNSSQTGCGGVACNWSSFKEAVGGESWIKIMGAAHELMETYHTHLHTQRGEKINLAETQDRK